MFLDIAKLSVEGFLKIINKDTGEILVETHNDILYGNLTTALAHSLIGNSDSLLYYMAFGDGGSFVGPGNVILYKPSLGGISSVVKNPIANLYNTLYVKKLSNNATSTFDYNKLSIAYMPAENYATSYEDIIVDVVLTYNEPPPAISSSPFIFNEIGLFAGSNNLFIGNSTTTVDEVNNFVSQTPNFSNQADTKSKLMLTHVIFHPLEKSSISNIEIIYTVRIQMSAN